MAWLGWVGGVPAFVLFFVVTMWTARMLADCFEAGGRKHTTYRSAVRHLLGPTGGCGWPANCWLRAQRLVFTVCWGRRGSYLLLAEGAGVGI